MWPFVGAVVDVDVAVVDDYFDLNARSSHVGLSIETLDHSSNN